MKKNTKKSVSIFHRRDDFIYGIEGAKMELCVCVFVVYGKNHMCTSFYKSDFLNS